MNGKAKITTSGKACTVAAMQKQDIDRMLGQLALCKGRVDDLAEGKGDALVLLGRLQTELIQLAWYAFDVAKKLRRKEKAE